MEPGYSGASITDDGTIGISASDLASIAWIEQVLPELARSLFGRMLLDDQFAQLPMAQVRLVKALPIDELGETMGHLSDMLRMQPSALSQAANRVIRHGLAERIDDPDDRRIVRLRLTLLGRKWRHDRIHRRRERLGLIWRRIDPVDRTEIIDAVRVLERISRRASALVSAAEQERTTQDNMSVKHA